MAKRAYLAKDKAAAIPHVGDHLLRWCLNNPGTALGGATGTSPIDVWDWVWHKLKARPADRDVLVNRDVLFLDEYFGAYPAYYHWAHHHLRVGNDGFESHRIYTPRGCFFEDEQIVNSDGLDAILDHCRGEWEGVGEGEDGDPPQIRIKSHAEHSVLCEIQAAMERYDRDVRTVGKGRLQLLGVGVGGKIRTDPLAGGHIGFVEYGAARRDTRTMLARLAKSTVDANARDFALKNDNGSVRLEPARFAVTQGIDTILDAGELLVMAWGKLKTEAVARMLLGKPCEQNPAAWIQDHDDVTVFLDEAAFGQLLPDQLEEFGWSVERLGTTVPD